MILTEQLSKLFLKFGVTLKEVKDVMLDIEPNNHAWALKGTLQHLYFAMASLVMCDVKNVLEIGTGLGESTIVLSKLFFNASIYTVDMPAEDDDFNLRAWRGMEKKIDAINKFTENIKLDNVKFFSSNSFFLPLLNIPEKFDLIFIDGGHTYPAVAWDIMYAYNHLKNGGMMIMHDYTLESYPKQTQVKDVLDYIGSRIKEKIWFFPGKPNNNNVKIPIIRNGRLK